MYVCMYVCIYVCMNQRIGRNLLHEIHEPLNGPNNQLVHVRGEEVCAQLMYVCMYVCMYVLL